MTSPDGCVQGENPQEHRNMPFDEAMSLLAKQTGSHGQGGPQHHHPQQPPQQQQQPNNDPKAIPNDIRACIGFLMDRRPLSVMEYDKLIRYFASKRESVLREEYGENIPTDLKDPPVGPNQDPATKAKINDLNDKILAILNKPKAKPAAAPAQAPIVTNMATAQPGFSSVGDSSLQVCTLSRFPKPSFFKQTWH